MTGGHRTTTISRPRDATPSDFDARPGSPADSRSDSRADSRSDRRSASRAVSPRAAPRSDDSKFGAILDELTRPIAVEKRLIKGRGKRLVFALVVTVIAAALTASLFVLPIKSWVKQHHDLATKRNELAVLNNANAQLTSDINRLQTPDGIKEAARQEVGYIGLGEQRMSVLSTPNAPLTLPTGWPYDTVTQILAVRAATPVSAPPTSVPPASTPPASTPPASAPAPAPATP